MVDEVDGATRVPDERQWRAEHRYRAVREVLDGAPVAEVARQCGTPRPGAAYTAAPVRSRRARHLAHVIAEWPLVKTIPSPISPGRPVTAGAWMS